MAIPSRFLLAVAYVTLCASFVASVIWRFPSTAGYFPYLLWIHVVLIALGFWASLRMRGLGLHVSEFYSACLRLPRELIFLGVLVLAGTVLSGINVELDSGTLPDGTAIRSRSWSERDGKFWLTVNKQAPMEIAEARYKELERESYGMVATIWLALSFPIVLQWRFLASHKSIRR